MLDLPRFLAKGLIYSFHFSSPACQDLSLLLNPSLLPASLEAPTRPASSCPLAVPSTLGLDYASPLHLGKTRWSHASLLHLTASAWLAWSDRSTLTWGPHPILITNFYFWFSKAHCSLNTIWSSFFFLSNYDFSKINFSSNNDDIQNTSLMGKVCVIT